MNPKETTFFEIILQSADFAFGGRDEIEDPLHDALHDAALRGVAGGGSGKGIANIDVEVNDAERGLELIRRVLRDLGVAPSTVIWQGQPVEVMHAVY